MVRVRPGRVDDAGRCSAKEKAHHRMEFTTCLQYHAKWALNACYPHLDTDAVLKRKSKKKSLRILTLGHP